MRVLVTGASGFVGAHIVAALIGSGHEVRAFVRSTEKLGRALDPFGIESIGTYQGDVSDEEAVKAALDTCDAVIHTANVYTYDPRMAEVMTKTNVEGTRSVLAAAVAAGCDPVVHVSTAAVTWPRPGGDSDSVPLSPLQGHPYSDSKKRAEQIARDYQDHGAPVVTTYPGGVLGPHDPGPGEQIALMRGFLVPTAPFRIDGGFLACDVEWNASVHIGLLTPGLGPRRVTCGGHYVTWQRWFEVARQLTGRRLPNPLPTPHWLLNATTSTANALQRVSPWRLPFSREAAWAMTSGYHLPDTEAIAIAGSPPPFEETLERAIRWASEAGHLTARQVGKLATSSG
jgi:dihydroflavonol-4-reductase